MRKRDIIVIGASAGGFKAIQKLISGLPPSFDASIFIAWHMAPDVKGILPQMLNGLHALPASHATDREPFRHRHIYVAPPDRHLLLEENIMRISRGPKENRFRPAIDPLFRSAAYVHGSRVIGIILSGALDDGTAGLWTIKKRGGICIVQDPMDANVSAMPRNAIQAVRVDHILPVSEIPELLKQLIQESIPDENGYHDVSEDIGIKREIDIAMGNAASPYEKYEEGDLTPYTCPECQGVLTALREGSRIRFRCHTGHAFSADSLLAAVTEQIEENLWTAVRSIQESVLLLNHMGDHFAEQNQPRLAAVFFKKAKDAEDRLRLVRTATRNHELLSFDGLQEQSSQLKDNSD